MIAGVVTFLALTLLLSLITAALGLGVTDLTSDNPGEGVGIATGLWSIVILALVLPAGGHVAGLLAGHAGLIHSFLTWATSLLPAVVVAGLLVGNILVPPATSWAPRLRPWVRPLATPPRRSPGRPKTLTPPKLPGLPRRRTTGLPRLLRMLSRPPRRPCKPLIPPPLAPCGPSPGC